MRRRRLLATFLIVVLLVSVAATAFADDRDGTEYSVLYHGNYSNEDAHRFSYRLYYLGADGTWNGITQWSTASGERDVNHWDYTNGYPGVDPYPGANARDILYTSGHGWPNMLRMYQPLRFGDDTRELDQLRRPDNIGPQDYVESDGERVNWEIGIDGLDTYRTTSRWDDDLEWAFLASCSQLSSTADSRLHYARTLLGDPQRAHGVYGYDATAPGDGVDVGIVDDFFDYVGAATSIRYAWLKANANYSQYNAAAVMHAANEWEGMPPICTPDPDTRVGSPAYIHYWYIPSWTYSPQPTAATDSWFESAREFLAGLWGVEEARASDPEVFVGEHTTYHLRTRLPELADLPVLDVRKGARRLGAADARRLLGGAPTRAEDVPGRARETLRGPAGTMWTWESGAQGVLFSGESTRPVEMTRQQAVDLATDFIEENGGLPEGAQLTGEQAFAESELDVENGSLGAERVHAYVVNFGRTLDGVEIAGMNGDGISVVVDGNGVREFRRQWREIDSEPGGQAARARVSASEALQVLAQEGDRYLDTDGETDITAVDLVYYSMSPERDQSELFPAWRITLDESDCFYVNAVTGRPTNE